MRPYHIAGLFCQGLDVAYADLFVLPHLFQQEKAVICHDVHLIRGLTEFEFLNSAGQRFRTRHTGCSVSLSLERFAADDILSIYDWDSATGDTIDVHPANAD